MSFLLDVLPYPTPCCGRHRPPAAATAPADPGDDDDNICRGENLQTNHDEKSRP